MSQTSDLSQFKDLFVSTAREYIQSLNTCVIKLEKEPDNGELIAEVFRSAHSLKGQSAAMNFASLGYLCHTIEDIFYEIQHHRLSLSSKVADVLFTAFDQMSQSLNNIETANQEIDVNSVTNQLKQLTGVATQGMGKSNRSEAGSPVNDISQKNHVSDHTPNLSTLSPSTAHTPVIHTAQISVKAKSLDDMLALVEELLVSEGKIKHLSHANEQVDIAAQAAHSEQLLDTLHYQVMKARAIPLALVFDQLPRTVRDAARREQKEVTFTVSGSELELDRSIIDKLTEPLIHLLRNAVSHGIQHQGTVWLTASKQQDWVEISVRDDGAGIDWQKLAQAAHQELPDDSLESQSALLFSGTSTAQTVSQVSGRGVGLLAVKHMVEQSSGTLSVTSEQNKGTTFTLRFPLSLAVMSVLHISIGSSHYLLPSSVVSQIVSATPQQILVAADQPAIIWQEQEIPLLSLQQQHTSPTDIPQDRTVAVIVMKLETTSIGLLVDSATDVLEVVVKPVPPSLSSTQLYAGCSVLPDGQTALVLNPKGLI